MLATYVKALKEAFTENVANDECCEMEEITREQMKMVIP